MVERAQQGATVVRLKGGDPFVFGRGGEEALALRAAGIPYEVVPGVTAGVAAPAYAGIPVTHRGLASAVALVTGHAAGPPTLPRTDVDWAGARGVSRNARAVHGGAPPAADRRGADRRRACGLRARGGRRSGHAAGPAHRVRHARRRSRRSPAARRSAPRRSPSWERSSALADELAWLKARPLDGRTVAVTRARAQASALTRRLEGLGARVVQAPVIRVRALPGPPLDPSPYDLICLTSPNACRAAVRAPGRGRARRPGAGRCARRGDRPGHRGGARRAWNRRRRRPRALRRRGARRKRSPRCPPSVR